MTTTTQTQWQEIAFERIPATVRFDVPGQNRGQAIEVAYGGFARAEHGADAPYKRVTDRSISPVPRYYRRVVFLEVEETTPITGYTTYGSVRGGCGHRHPTREAAERCAANDAHACARQGGYSDREVAEIDNNDRLYRSIAADDWIPGPGGRACGAARF